MTSWRRNTNAQPLELLGSYWNDAISGGDTYLRVHIRWGFHLDTPLNVDMAYLAASLVTFGLCTVIGDGSESPPEAATSSIDTDPPTQRWIYWETLAPVLQGISHEDGMAVWGNSAQTEPTQTRGQVLATGLPAGDTLNLWASWQSSILWSAQFDANATIWHSVSILRKNTIP